MESVSIFSEKFCKIVNGPITNVLLENSSENKDNEESPADQWSSKSENNLSCSYCRIEFSDLSQQREHYKLDWHRYNLKQSLSSKLPITEENFNEKTGNDDLSSISGSDSEKDDILDSYALAQGKIFLGNDKKQVFSIYRCLLFDKKEEISDPQTLLYKIEDTCIINQKWAILMLGGGHFAGAVFQGDETVLHKTFHCYTVRAGQGGSQSSRDNKSGGSQPKSAGASLRRYNEQALVQHVNSVVDSWRPEINQCSLIIYRASGPYNRSVFFGGSNPLLDRLDKRLRTIPFSTRRATFTEVKRVHSVLSSAQVYGSLEAASALFAKQKSPEIEAKRAKSKSSCINRAKSREVLERPLPGTKSSTSDSENELSNFDNLETNDLEVSFDDLQEFGDSLTPEQRSKGQRKRKPKKSQAKKLREQEEARKKELVDVLVKGNVLSMKSLLEKRIQQTCGENEQQLIDTNEVKNAFVNEILDDNGNSMLHIAALNEHEEMIDFLLENGGDPCLKNKNSQTVYTCTQSKIVREALKQYARRNPTKHNYNKANIPLITLTDEEISEKKKAQRKIKKEKEKVKKKENEVKKKEQDEQDRFLKLSDREKRALAAERRILNSSCGTISTLRCFLCGADITGKVPFEYSGNRFCSVDCLKAHRMQQPVKLS